MTVDQRAPDAPRTSAPSNVIDLIDAMKAREDAAYLKEMWGVAVPAVSRIETCLADGQVDPLECAAFILAIFVIHKARREDIPVFVVLDVVMPLLGHYLQLAQRASL